MISIVYCTREHKPEHSEHLKKTCGLPKAEVIEYVNNGEGLTKVYNKFLKETKYDIVVFCHDDIEIRTKNWGEKLLKHYKRNPEFGILGVAGSKELQSSGKWWEDARKMYGQVYHTQNGKTWLSAYSKHIGNLIEETVIVDGVFFSVNKNVIKDGFGEDFEGFHFYDIDFCFKNYINGVKVGVHFNIEINHYSVGETNEQWEINRNQFSEKYKENLPVEVNKVFRKGDKMKILLAPNSFRGYSIQEFYILELALDLIKQGHDVSICSQLGGPLTDKAKAFGIKLYNINEPPHFKLGDGKWEINTQNGLVPSKEGSLYPISKADFDLLYLTDKQVGEFISKVYPNTPTIYTVFTNDGSIDPIIGDKNIVKYIVLDNTVKSILINEYKMDVNIIDVYESPKEKRDIDTYIFIHNQELLLRLIESQKFNQFTNLNYVFLGDGDVDKLNDINNIIYANKLPYNIENYPKFTAFSGWYALWKNKLIKENNNILLLEYDVNLVDNFENLLRTVSVDKLDMTGFVPFDMNNYHYINNPDWVGTISKCIKNTYNIDILDIAKQDVIKHNRLGSAEWMSTNNIMFTYKTFIDYMKWFEPLIDGVKDDIFCGHAQERCLTFYAIIKNVKYGFGRSILKHEQLDSHKTQGHNSNYEESIKKLL